MIFIVLSENGLDLQGIPWVEVGLTRTILQ